MTSALYCSTEIPLKSLNEVEDGVCKVRDGCTLLGRIVAVLIGRPSGVNLSVFSSPVPADWG
jgi:hypothetical protein